MRGDIKQSSSVRTAISSDDQSTLLFTKDDRIDALLVRAVGENVDDHVLVPPVFSQLLIRDVSMLR